MTIAEKVANKSSMLETIGKYVIFFILFVIAAFLGGLLHEAGHYTAGSLLNWKPMMSFVRGGSVHFENEPAIKGYLSLLSLLAGPVVTFSLAVITFKVWQFYSVQFFLALALWNSLFRMSLLIDGKGSDEAKMSSILGIPFVFEIISISLSIGLAYFILQSQDVLPKTPFMIPVYLLFCAIAYRISFGVCSLIFG